MARILRGDVIWADLSPTKGKEQSGSRPVLVLSQEVFNRKSETVIALALTSKSQRAGFPLTFELAGKGLPKKAWVKISQILTLSVERLGRRMGPIEPDELEQIIDGLNEIIGG